MLHNVLHLAVYIFNTPSVLMHAYVHVHSLKALVSSGLVEDNHSYHGIKDIHVVAKLIATGEARCPRA